MESSLEFAGVLQPVIAPELELATTPVPRGAFLGNPGLRRILICLDATMVALAWAVALGVPGGSALPAAETAAAALLVTVGTLALLAWQRLYLARVCSVRAVEISRLFRVVVLSSAAAAIGLNRLRLDVA